MCSFGLADCRFHSNARSFKWSHNFPCLSHRLTCSKFIGNTFSHNSFEHTCRFMYYFIIRAMNSHHYGRALHTCFPPPLLFDPSDGNSSRRRAARNTHTHTHTHKRQTILYLNKLYSILELVRIVNIVRPVASRLRACECFQSAHQHKHTHTHICMHARHRNEYR